MRVRDQRPYDDLAKLVTHDSQVAGSNGVHLSGRTARRFGMSDRGRLRPGYVADIAVVDPETVADRSRYEDPRRYAMGIDDVLVGGRQVLAGGELTGVNAGRGLRRSA